MHNLNSVLSLFKYLNTPFKYSVLQQDAPESEMEHDSDLAALRRVAKN